MPHLKDYRIYEVIVASNASKLRQVYNIIALNPESATKQALSVAEKSGIWPSGSRLAAVDIKLNDGRQKN